MGNSGGNRKHVYETGAEVESRRGRLAKILRIDGIGPRAQGGHAACSRHPTNKRDLVTELRSAAAKLDAVGRLRTYGVAPQILESAASKTNHFFLLELDAAEMQLNITGYKSKDMAAASSAYLAAETRFAQAAAGGDAVLVSVESIAALKRAYPNYYLDTNMFVELVEEALKGEF